MEEQRVQIPQSSWWRSLCSEDLHVNLHPICEHWFLSAVAIELGARHILWPADPISWSILGLLLSSFKNTLVWISHQSSLLFSVRNTNMYLCFFRYIYSNSLFFAPMRFIQILNIISLFLPIFQMPWRPGIDYIATVTIAFLPHTWEINWWVVFKIRTFPETEIYPLYWRSAWNYLWGLSGKYM